ncbi:hypothetical protein [Actinomadura sp. SCN-SB]
MVSVEVPGAGSGVPPSAMVSAPKAAESELDRYLGSVLPGECRQYG